MNSIGSWIISLRSDEAEKEQGTTTLAATLIGGENEDVEREAIKI